MKTVKTSANGKVLLTERIAGFAVSMKVTEWDARARQMFTDWKTVATGLSRADAESTFAKLAA